MKVAKIIATCFKPRKVREKTQLVGNPIGYFAHSQKFENTNDNLNLLNFILEKEIEYDPGIDRDLIIVNSDVNDSVGNNFLDTLHNKKISRGKIIIIHRKNYGMSYGGYNEAYTKYKNDYDYFLFTEDDVIILGSNNLKIGVEILEEYNDYGFLSYIQSTKIGKWHWNKLNLNKKIAYGCHGATGLVSKKMLNLIYSKYGELPHNKGNDYYDCITYGEVGFPNSVVKLGYKIHNLPNNLIFAVPAYDLMRNIQYRKYPNFFEKINFITKSILYKLASQTKFTLNIYIYIINFIKKFYKR